MANPENLVPNEARTPSQRRENARKAGRASGRKRREMREMRETLRAMLDMPLRPGGVTTAQTMDAMDGDTRAAEFVRDTSGQRPSDRVEPSAPSRESAEEFGRMLDEAMRDGG